MIVPLLREARASARSQLVSSLLGLVVVAGMCAAVLLTTGRTVAAEEAALGAIDSAGTRSVILRSSDDTSLTAGMLDSLDEIEGVEGVAGFGAVADVRNAALPGGELVPARRVYGELTGRLMDAGAAPVGNSALATRSAIERLGLANGVGAVVDAAGLQLEVVGTVAIPDHLGIDDTAVLRPSSTAESLAGAEPGAPLAMIAVVAESPDQVAAVGELMQSLLPPGAVEGVTLETSEELATIRLAVQGELGRFGRGTVLGILAVSALLVGVNTFSSVMMHRKDFGRRRALGAKQGLLIALLLSQTAIVAAIGSLVGCAVATAALLIGGDAAPSPGFTAAVGVLAILCATVAALGPALWAANRDPLHELRVP